jgi:hypothetical protein
MIHSFNFSGTEFADGKEDHTCGGYFGELGNNVVLICSDLLIKGLIVEQIKWACGKIECDTQIDGGGSLRKYQVVCTADYVDTTVMNVDSTQKFYISVCPSFIYMANAPEELWFATYDTDKKIYFYSFSEYKDYGKLWRRFRGKDKIYSEYRNGIYDGYAGLYESLGIDADDYNNYLIKVKRILD